MSKFFKRTRDEGGFWGAIQHFFYGNIQRTFLGIRKILGIFLWNMGTQTPRGAANICFFLSGK